MKKYINYIVIWGIFLLVILLNKEIMSFLKEIKLFLIIGTAIEGFLILNNSIDMEEENK